MKKSLKEKCKKLLILSLILILMVAYIPVNEIYAYVNETNEVSLQNTKELEKNEITNETNSKNSIENANTTTETSDIADEEIEDLENSISNDEIKPIEKDKLTNTIKNNTNEQVNKIEENNVIQNTEVNSNNNNRAVESYSDLSKFVTSAKIYDQNGNEVTEGIIPDATYSIHLRFDETENKQFKTDENGNMTYKLPEFVKVLHGIEEQDIVSSEGITLGSYSISEEGLVTVKWDYVDREGNEADDLYIDHYENAFLLLTFDSRLSIDKIDEDIVIDFGNDVKINVSFDDAYSLTINKEATINDEGQKFDSKTHTINYNAKLMTYGDMKSLHIEDKLDSHFELDISKPIITKYNYENGTERTVVLDVNNYPNSIVVNDNGKTTTINGAQQISEYISINNGGFVLNYIQNGEVLPSQTEIITNYTTKIKDEFLENNHEGTINLTVLNTVTGKGVLNNKDKEVTSTDSETVLVNEVRLYKQGQYVEAGNQEVGNKQDVIVWHIQIGNGNSIISGTTITDTLGEGLEFAMDEPCTLVLYDEAGNAYYMTNNSTTLSQLVKDYGININGNILTWTVPNNILGNDTEIYRADIYYCTYFDMSVSTGYDSFKNSVTATGPIGDVGTSGETWIAGDLATLNKNVEPIRRGDEDITYSIDMSVPGTYYQKPLGFYDLTELHVGNVWNGTSYVEQVYHVNYADISEYFENNLKITANTASGEEIEFVNAKTNPDAPYNYYVSYSGVSGYGQVIIVFNGYDINTSSWNINENSVLHIEYKIPVNSPVYNRNEPNNSKGTLEEYSGEKIVNIIEALTKNEEIDQTITIGKDQVEAIIPEIMDKEYILIDNTNIAKFSIEINKEKTDLVQDSETLTIIDTMSPTLEFLGNTLEVYKYNEQTGNYDIEITDFTYTVETDSNTNETIVKIVVPDEERLELRYNCLMTGTGVVAISNLAKIEGVVGSSTKTEYNFEVQNSSAVSGGSETGLDFYILKYGEKSGEKTVLSGIEFELLNEERETIATPITDANGKIELNDIEKGTYYLKELTTKEPEYIKLDDEITITIDDDNNLSAYYPQTGIVQVLTDLNNEKYIEVINKSQEEIELSGTKIWNDNDNNWKTRPESITVNLLANGEVVASKNVTAADNWKYSFTNLPKYDEDVGQINYTIDEIELGNYSSQIRGTDIVNTLITTNVSGTKTWSDFDNKWETRPEVITVNLLANGDIVTSKEVRADASGNWKYEFTNLPKYDKEGKEIEYTVSETEVKGYKAEISGMDITNTLEQIH